MNNQPKYVKNAPTVHPKYELTEWFKWYEGEKVYRIRALRAFDEVEVGQLGGYVLGEHNLSHEGNCWIAQYAIATHQSKVTNNAWALDYSVLRDEAQLKDSACIFDNVVLRGNCVIEGAVQMYGHTNVGGRMHLTGNLHFKNRYELSMYIQNRNKP